MAVDAKLQRFSIDTEELLFGKSAANPLPEWVLGVGAVETILAVILLFLLGLGLRNMFRV